MKIVVNGQERIVNDNPQATLLWVLRDELQLTGTKYSCCVGDCGRCTVHLDGEATPSCITSLAEIAGKEVRTIDALNVLEDRGASTMRMVNQALIDDGLDDCTWCASGQIMTAAALLEEKPLPNSDEIREEVAQIYCICGRNTRIFSAVERAAEEMVSIL